MDPEYLAGLRYAVSAAIEYGLAVVACNPNRPPSIPAPLLIQARLAARNGITLDTVLSRCFAGYTILSHFLMEEIEADAIEASILKNLMQTQTPHFERLIAAVTEEYMREGCKQTCSAEQRKLEKVRRLLTGEILDTSDLPYEFDANHLGAISFGPDAAEGIRKLAKSLGYGFLSVRLSEESVWAWFATHDTFDSNRIEAFVSTYLPSDTSLTIGEPGHALAGWRITHHQAAAAFPIALHKGERFIRYRDVALIASMSQDNLLTTSLRELYVTPLVAGQDGGTVQLATLRAYFAAGRNISSAAKALRVNRRTVAYRLRKIEEVLGSPLTSIAVDAELALRLHSLDRFRMTS